MRESNAQFYADTKSDIRFDNRFGIASMLTLLYESPKDSLGKCFVLFFIGTHLMKL